MSVSQKILSNFCNKSSLLYLLQCFTHKRTHSILQGFWLPVQELCVCVGCWGRAVIQWGNFLVLEGEDSIVHVVTVYVTIRQITQPP